MPATTAIDPTLVALVEDAIGSPQLALIDATLAALADRITEVEPADRLAILASLVHRVRSAEVQAQAARDTMTKSLTQHHGSRRFTQRIRLPAEAPTRVHDLQSRAMRDEMASAVANALQDDHWYAVRFTQTADSNSPAPYSPFSTTVVTRTLDIVPLDGGPISDPPASFPSS